MATVTLLILFGELKLFLAVIAITANTTTEIPQNNNITYKSNEFVNIIKEDLRRNNDDYLDVLAKNTATSYSDKKIIITSTVHIAPVKKRFSIEKKQSKNHSSFKQNLIDGRNRRALDISLDNKATNIAGVAKEKTNTLQKWFTKVTKLPTVTKQSVKYKISTNKHTKFNINNLEDVKSFLEKNKDMLEDFISKKNLQTLTQVQTTTKGMMLRMRAHEIIEDHTLPNDEQLDMAPAKGGTIHSMRIKGRLCQRSVLMPEGPKYDSKGNVYLRAFSPKPGQDYARTISPPLILPRCCNCCKKSVLGCE